MRRLVWMAMGLVLAAVSIAAAQQGQSSVQGRVVDASGAALPGVTVLITHEGSGVFRQVVSNADGSYFATGLVPGPYRIEAELTGFRKYERLGLLLQVGSTCRSTSSSRSARSRKNVTVTGESPLVDVTSTQVATNIDQQELAALPILNRNWMFAVSLTPGIQLQSSTASFACESLIVGGGSNRSGNFSVDGGGNNDDYLGSSCGSQTRTALEAVQEFQVLTNQYDAEFGRTAGAVINAITKQGTNAFRGSLFGSYTGDEDDGERLLRRAEQPREARHVADRLGRHARRPDRSGTGRTSSTASIAWSTPKGRSNTFTARPELNYSNTQRMKLWNHMIRVDHQINGTNTGARATSSRVSPTYDRVAGRRTQVARDQEFDVDRTAVATWNSVFGNTRFNTLRGGYTWEKNGFTAKEVQDGIPMTELPPSLTMLTFLDGFANGAQFRINGRLRGERFVLLVRAAEAGRVARHQVRRPVHLFDHRAARPDGHERPVRLLDRPGVQSEQSALAIRSGCSSGCRRPAPCYMPTHVGVLFAQDKWATRQPDGEPGPALRHRSHADTERFQPVLHRRVTIRSTRTTSRRASASRGIPVARHRQLVRGGWGLFYDKITLITTDAVPQPGRLQRFVRRRVPDRSRRSGSELRAASDRSDAGQRTGRESRRDQRAVPAGIDRPQHRQSSISTIRIAACRGPAS